jgi:hypothetical protein
MTKPFRDQYRWRAKAPAPTDEASVCQPGDLSGFFRAPHGGGPVAFACHRVYRGAPAPGCGYHVSGHGDLMPKTIKTIAIPAFGNITVRYQLARLLPADITREFLSRTHYAIVADPARPTPCWPAR